MRKQIKSRCRNIVYVHKASEAVKVPQTPHTVVIYDMSDRHEVPLQLNGGIPFITKIRQLYSFEAIFFNDIFTHPATLE